MRYAVLALLLAAGGASAASAGEVCNTLRMRGDYDLAQACEIDQSERQIAREEERRQREAEDATRRLSEESERSLERTLRLLDERARSSR